MKTIQLRALDIELKGKYQLLISGYAWLIHLLEMKEEHRERQMKNISALSLELEELEGEIKLLRKEYELVSGGERWGRSIWYRL